MWLTLADHYLHEEHLEWRQICQFAFNDRVNPDDHKLSVTIVKACASTSIASSVACLEIED